MKINLKRDKYVEIKGLSEASIESPDVQLAAVLDYVSRSLKHVERFGQVSGKPSWDVLFEVRNACLSELDRRRGNCFDHKRMIEIDFPDFLSSLNAEDVVL